ncbi:cyclic nucleotide-binding domain-containing protein 1 isoform B [Alligator mississippiensis]|uniref:Cyclic nucleotide-binding domain-containing protein 1 isoform B n=1 Tax=Alligator mississippiensis TaxID=8496 RepID=A0A151PH43_ALLMI|nr:cyclic nucleotide-binding domain-containing protein 1 isoform B [Alligator mississippiensis]
MEKRSSEAPSRSFTSVQLRPGLGYPEQLSVVGNQGFYVILKGSAKPRTKFYKRMLGEDCDSLSVEPSSIIPFGLSARTLLVSGSCFGTLESLSPKMQHMLMSVITEEDCEILKISCTDYLRVKEEIAKRGQLAKEDLIHGCSYYCKWPMLYISQLTPHLQWKQYLAGHVLVKKGEISTFIGFISSGCCNIYREVEALVKLPLGKRVKRKRQVLVGQLHKMQSFGEVSILLQAPFTCTIITATAVKLGTIDANVILGLDTVTQMLFLQTAEPTFGSITQDEINFEYINKERHKEWQVVKNMVVQDILFHNGIVPGLGKWTHELSHPAKAGCGKRQNKCC